MAAITLSFGPFTREQRGAGTNSSTFLTQKILVKFSDVISTWSAKIHIGWQKFATFRKQLAIFMQKQDNIYSWFLWKLNRKLYAFYEMVILPMIFDDHNHHSMPLILIFGFSFITSSLVGRQFKFGMVCRLTVKNISAWWTNPEKLCLRSRDVFK